MKNCLSSWSGGKDSAYALYLTIQSGAKPMALLNMMNENGLISRSHGLPLNVLQAQANAMQLPIYTVASSWQDYEKNFTDTLLKLKQNHGIHQVVFGDIDLQAHRDWEEKVCAAAELEAYLPLWLANRKALVLEMLAAGFAATIVSCQPQMGFNFLGRTLTPELVDELSAKGVDPCGENGEFHTVVTNCPMFDQPISLRINGKINHQDYCFLQLG